jgi:hypothetical protein
MAQDRCHTSGTSRQCLLDSCHLSLHRSQCLLPPHLLMHPLQESVKWEERLSAAQAEARQARQRAEQLESEVVSLQSKLRSNSVPQVSLSSWPQPVVDFTPAPSYSRLWRWLTPCQCLFFALLCLKLGCAASCLCHR